jgi:hypothetical protein
MILAFSLVPSVSPLVPSVSLRSPKTPVFYGIETMTLTFEREVCMKAETNCEEEKII